VEKEIICHYAAELVSNDDSILLDSSSTIYYFALALEVKQGLRVITNGLDAARMMVKNPSTTVILIGGILIQAGSFLTGQFSKAATHEYHVQKAFVSCSGFSVQRGLTEVNRSYYCCRTGLGLRNRQHLDAGNCHGSPGVAI
jgi:DeoR/GlpR family transcriptional regulator of sugar metabolism